MANLKYLQVVEIIDPIKSGATQPYRCRLEDNQIYAIKGRYALTQGLLAEVCAASVGRAMGLPIPDFVAADIPEALVRNFWDPEASRALGVGLGFASLWQDFCEPVTPTIRDRQSAQFLATLYAFDHWIANGDRSLGDEDGNPNLLYDFKNKKIVVFDHNLAFSAHYDASDLSVHAGRRAWETVGKDSSFRSNLLGKMDGARLAFDEVIVDLPEKWIEHLPGFTGMAAGVLDKCKAPDFWDQLG